MIDIKTATPGPNRRRLLAASAAVWLAGCQTAPSAPPAAAPPALPPAIPPVVPPPGAAATPPAPPPLQPPPPKRPPRLGLALGGGAARGFAHIGVIQVLEEAGIRPDLVVGTSAGSLVAALYAHGRNGADLASLALAMDEGSITDWGLPSRGLIRGEALARYVREHTGGLPMERLARPLGIVAADLASGEPVLFRRGDPGLAVRASSAVPAVFQPVRIGDREYVDGGLVAPVPVRFAREMGAEMVIAVDISTPPDDGSTGGLFGVLMQTFAIMGRSISRHELAAADVVLRPGLTGLSSANFTNRVRAIRAGREEALARLDQIRERLAALAR